MRPGIGTGGGVPPQTLDVATTVRDILARHVGCPIDDVRLDSRLEHDLELDSFGVIRFTVGSGAHLDRRRHRADDLNLITVGDLIA
jgi:acyl carrier protein